MEDKDKPLCCGAAQRFLKDGTKLSIETCQLADATTYTYYPALPAGAVVAPTPETWRFQCISAAQKLAAAATAALAAGYRWPETAEELRAQLTKRFEFHI